MFLSKPNDSLSDIRVEEELITLPVRPKSEEVGITTSTSSFKKTPNFFQNIAVLFILTQTVQKVVDILESLKTI